MNVSRWIRGNLAFVWEWKIRILLLIMLELRRAPPPYTVVLTWRTVRQPHFMGCYMQTYIITSLTLLILFFNRVLLHKIFLKRAFIGRKAQKRTGRSNLWNKGKTPIWANFLSIIHNLVLQILI